MSQAILISILNLLVSFVESAFYAKSDYHDADEDFFKSNSSNHHHQQQQQHANLQEAYRFMELEPPVTIEKVRQQWKRLSLRYHPDRNGGSEESQALQQKLNQAFNRIEEVLAGAGGGDDDDNNQEEEEQEPPPEDEEEEMPYEEPLPKRPQQYQQTRNRRKSRKERNLNSKAARRQQEKAESAASRRRREVHQKRQEEMRREMKREMEEEQRRVKERTRKLRRAQDEIRRKTSRLYDFEQREAANRLFMNQVEKELERRKEKRPQSSPSPSSNTNQHLQNVEKPKHYVMESCTHDLVVAMRLGMDELALQLLDGQIANRIQCKLRDYAYLERMQRKFGAVTHQLLSDAAMVEILSQQRLDDDQNTLLHYAVYWERPVVIRILCELAQRHGYLDRLVLMENSHGYTAMDLASIATDPSIWPLMQTQKQLVQLYLEQTRLGPAMAKAGRDLWSGGMKKLDVVTTANTVLGYLIGRWAFRLHWIVAVLGVGLLQAPSLEEEQAGFQVDRMSDAATLVSSLTCVKVVLFAWQQRWRVQVMWKLLFILNPLILLLMLCPLYFMFCRVFYFGVEGPLYAFDFVRNLLYGSMRTVETQIMKRQPAIIRRRPGLTQTVVLIGVLILSGLIQSILSLLVWDAQSVSIDVP
jgi:hypothetical protein